jgi:hypothetical protein
VAHCPPEKLSDLNAIFDEIRSWPGIQEKKLGIFYFKGKGFLHFHYKAGRRWADVREGADWGSEIDLPFEFEQIQAKNFLQAVKKRYLQTTNKI